MFLLQLLGTRVAMYKLRQYLKKMNPKILPELIDRTGKAVDFKDILQRTQQDVSNLERVGEVSDLVEPLVSYFSW